MITGYAIVFAYDREPSDHRFWTGRGWSSGAKNALVFDDSIDAHAAFEKVTRPLCFNAHTFLVAGYGTGHSRTVLSVGTTDAGTSQIIDHDAARAA